MTYLGAPDDTRTEAVKWSEEHGIPAAMNKFRVSRETIRRWRKERGVSNKCRRADPLEGFEN